jgi:hypothetical protein
MWKLSAVFLFGAIFCSPLCFAKEGFVPSQSRSVVMIKGRTDGATGFVLADAFRFRFVPKILWEDQDLDVVVMELPTELEGRCAGLDPERSKATGRRDWEKVD